MGRSRWLSFLKSFFVNLLENSGPVRADEIWESESIEAVLAEWPHAREKVFFHLSRLYRFGFQLQFLEQFSERSLELSHFFADGKQYRPERQRARRQNSFGDLALLGKGTLPLRMGQFRVTRAKPVLDLLGFGDFVPEREGDDVAVAIQFAGFDDESWIFVDSRPEVFRRTMASAVAERLANSADMELSDSVNPQTQSSSNSRGLDL